MTVRFSCWVFSSHSQLQQQKGGEVVRRGEREKKKTPKTSLTHSTSGMSPHPQKHSSRTLGSDRAQCKQHPPLFPLTLNFKAPIAWRIISLALGLLQRKARSCHISCRFAASANSLYTFICSFSKRNPSWITSPGWKTDTKNLWICLSWQYLKQGIKK